MDLRAEEASTSATARRSNDAEGDPILRVVLTTISLLSADAWQEVVPGLLPDLGAATRASRVYLFENTTLPDGRLAMDMRFEWVAPGISAELDAAINHGYPYDDGYQRYVEILSSGGAIHGPTVDFPAGERADLEKEGILATAFVPVFAGGEWWGYLGFDDCVAPRLWSTVEIQTLQAVAGVLGSAIHRERLVAESREREAMLRAHVEGIPAMTYVEYADDDNEFGYTDAYVSPQVEAILGYTVEEWLNDFDTARWTESVHPDDRERVEELSERTTRTGEPYVIEYRMRRKDGEWIWVRDESHLVQSDDTPRPYWHGVMTDITQRKEAQLQSELQAKLIESISDAVIAYDIGMTVTSWNRAAQVLYGWTADDIVGRPLPDPLRSDPDDPGFSSIWDPFVEDLNGWRGSVTQQDKDGYEIPVETKVLPLRDADDSVRGWVMVNREIADA